MVIVSFVWNVWTDCRINKDIICFLNILYVTVFSVRHVLILLSIRNTSDVSHTYYTRVYIFIYAHTHTKFILPTQQPCYPYLLFEHSKSKRSLESFIYIYKNTVFLISNTHFLILSTFPDF